MAMMDQIESNQPSGPTDEEMLAFAERVDPVAVEEGDVPDDLTVGSIDDRTPVYANADVRAATKRVRERIFNPDGLDRRAVQISNMEAIAEDFGGSMIRARQQRAFQLKRLRDLGRKLLAIKVKGVPDKYACYQLWMQITNNGNTVVTTKDNFDLEPSALITHIHQYGWLLNDLDYKDPTNMLGLRMLKYYDVAWVSQLGTNPLWQLGHVTGKPVCKNI
jgi:hypothetical protein